MLIEYISILFVYCCDKKKVEYTCNVALEFHQIPFGKQTWSCLFEYAESLELLWRNFPWIVT